MAETEAQQASHELAEAVFADPATREQFEAMAKATAEREPVPDDFGWLADERDSLVPVSYAALSKQAAEAGMTVPELLRQEATRLASRPSMQEWLERTRRRPSRITAADISDALDDVRGPWPDARR